MKIIFLFPHFLSPGGAANVVLQFARELQERKHQVEIWCAKVSKEYRENNPGINFNELKIPASNSVFYWLFFPFWQMKIERKLKGYKKWILFPQVLPSNWWAWRYKRNYENAKVVWYCHEPSAFIHSPTWINAIPVQLMKWGAKALNPFLRKIDIKMEKGNDLVICNSHFTQLQYEKIYGRRADAVIYPPCLVKDVSVKREKENCIITVGRLSKFKNVDLLIRAFKIVSGNFPASKLIVVGTGEEKENLLKLVSDLGLKDLVFFTGKINDQELSTLYQNAKVTVICSRNEAFGLVPVESMQHGTPVIAHNSGGPKETIVPFVNGFLYETEKDLVEFIRQIFEMNEDRYFSLQQNCIRGSSKYNISSAVDQLEALLQKLSLS